jgi:putative signal transducing protein
MAPVTLTVVHDQFEAEELCGLLRANGIDCMYRGTSMSAGFGLSTTMGGPTEVFVEEGDLERAREFLPEEPEPTNDLDA